MSLGDAMIRTRVLEHAHPDPPDYNHSLDTMQLSVVTIAREAAEDTQYQGREEDRVYDLPIY